MMRSLIFTALLDAPGFGALDSRDASRVVTDAELRVKQDQAANPSLTLAAIMDAYIDDITVGTEPGVWGRYVVALRAGDEIRTPAAAVDALGETTTHDELIRFATDSTRFDGDIADLF